MLRDSNLASGPTTIHTCAVPLRPSQSINAPDPSAMHMPPTGPSFGPSALPNSTSPASPAHGQVNMLQHEVDFLHDRRRHQQDVLNREPSAKRKLDDSLNLMHHRPRHLEKHLNEASMSAVSALRGEVYALHQCRYEQQSRRRAESTVSELRAYMPTMEPILERGGQKKNTREFLRKVATSMMKAPSGGFAAATLLTLTGT